METCSVEKHLAFQSNYVGLALMCKRFTDLWCSTSWRGNVDGTYCDSVPSNMTAERRVIYKVLMLLGTHRPDGTRSTFANTYISSIKSSISTELRREVLENNMKEMEDTSADEILTSLSGIMESSDGASAGIDPTEEFNAEELDADDALGDESEVVLVDDDEHRPAVPVSFSTKKMHPLISSNPWIIGSDKLREKDILYNGLKVFVG